MTHQPSETGQTAPTQYDIISAANDLSKQLVDLLLMAGLSNLASIAMEVRRTLSPMVDSALANKVVTSQTSTY